MRYDTQFIVHTPTRKLSRSVQEKFFGDGIPWCGGSRTYSEIPIKSYGEDGCIRFNLGSHNIRCGDRQFYTRAYPHVPVISAGEFLNINENQAMFIQPVVEEGR